jgi:hypothetical protein
LLCIADKDETTSAVRDGNKGLGLGGLTSFVDEDGVKRHGPDEQAAGGGARTANDVNRRQSFSIKLAL